MRGLLRGNGLAAVALFVALGGGAYAAATIDSGDIKKNAVKAKHIKANAVRGGELKANSVGSSELNADSVGSSELRGDSVGPAELAGFENAETTSRFVDLNTAVASDGENILLLETTDGSINVRGQCIWVQGDNEVTADVSIGGTGPDIQITGGPGTDPGADTGFETVDPTGNGLTLETIVRPLGTFAQTTGSFAGLAPDGTALQGTYHIAVNDNPAGQDCTFSVVAFG